MRLRNLFATLVLVGILACASSLLGSSANATEPDNPKLQPTAFPTPTPGPDGTIIYIVKEGDTLWRIAAIAGMKPEELAALNGMQVNDYLTVGMKLILGLGGPAEPTAGPGAFPSPTPIPPTPTPVFGTGEICVLLYVDDNGNGRREEGEAPLDQGQVSVAVATGELAGEHQTTTDPEGYCFTDLQNGNYNVSAAAPADYNPTTSMNLPVSLKPGDIHYVEFGAQPSAALHEPPPTGGEQRSLLLGILGVVLLLAAGGLGYAATRTGRGKPLSLR